MTTKPLVVFSLQTPIYISLETEKDFFIYRKRDHDVKTIGTKNTNEMVKKAKTTLTLQLKFEKLKTHKLFGRSFE